LMSPQGNHSLQLQQLWDKHGQPILRAPGAGHRVQIALPEGMDSEFVLIIRDLPQTAPELDAQSTQTIAPATANLAAGCK
jgi:putative protease